MQACRSFVDGVYKPAFSISRNLVKLVLTKVRRIAKKWKLHADSILDAKQDGDLDRLDGQISAVVSGSAPPPSPQPAADGGMQLVAAAAFATLAFAAWKRK